MTMPNWRPIRRCLTSDVINAFIYSLERERKREITVETISIKLSLYSVYTSYIIVLIMTTPFRCCINY